MTDETLSQLTVATTVPAGAEIIIAVGPTGSKVYEALDPAAFSTPAQTTAAINNALTGYATTSSVTASINTAVAGLATSAGVTSAITTALTGYATTTSVTSAITTALVGYATTTSVTSAINTALTGYATTSSVTAAINTAVAGLATAASVTAEATARAAADALLLPLTGGTLTGALTLSGAPTQNLHPATKAYVDTQVSGVSGGGTPSSTTPLMDGVGAAGSSTNYARGDHVHPVDTSRYAATNPAGYQTASQVNTAIQAVVGAAPTALDTLAEIATQLQSDETAAGALTTAVGLKAPLDSPTFTTKVTLPSVAAGISAAGVVVFNNVTGRYEFGVGGGTVNHVRLSGDTMAGVLTLSATAAAGDNSSKAATTAYSDRPFTRTTPGAAPASGGTTGTANFLREDGIWAVPAGGSGTGTVNTGTTNTLAFYASNGTAVSPLTLGTNLSISGTTLNAAGGSSSAFPVTTVAASSTAQTLTFPASGLSTFDVTLTGSCVFSFNIASITAGQRSAVEVWVRAGTGGFTPSYPAGVKWSGPNGNVAPSGPITSGALFLVTFKTPDAGTTIVGEY